MPAIAATANPVLVLVMGVSGCGKTTIGKKLAATLASEARDRRWTFLDADDFHPPANIAKMSAGIPLDDADRAPWLATLRARIDTAARDGENIVLACSALKTRYRSTLIANPACTLIAWLHAPREVFAQRLSERTGHFMKAAMLDSQLAALETPQPSEAAAVLVVDVTQPLDANVAQIADASRTTFTLQRDD